MWEYCAAAHADARGAFLAKMSDIPGYGCSNAGVVEWHILIAIWEYQGLSPWTTAMRCHAMQCYAMLVASTCRFDSDFTMYMCAMSRRRGSWLVVEASRRVIDNIGALWLWDFGALGLRDFGASRLWGFATLGLRDFGASRLTRAEVCIYSLRQVVDLASLTSHVTQT
mgnify:CR=1 FL=1